MALDPVILRFATAGLPEFQAACQQAATVARKFEEQTARESARGSKNRVDAARREGEDRTKAAQRVQRDIAKFEEQRTRDTEKEAKRRQDVERRSSEMAGRYAAQLAKEEESQAQRSARAVERMEEYKMRVRIRSSEMAGRAAAAAAREEERAVQKQTAAVRGAAGRFGSAVGGTLALMGASAGAATGFLMADAGRRELNDEKAAALLVNSATAGGVAAPGANVGNILSRAGAAAQETGVSRGDLIKATSSYVQLAGADKFGTAMANMSFFGKLSQATGSSLEDITGAAGILQAQNKNLGSNDIQQMLLDIMEQGKQGAVEIKDLAHLAGSLGSTRGLYAGSPAENQRKLLAMAQISRTESESPEEAATAIKDMGLELLKGKHKEIAKRWGVKFTKEGKIEDMQQMMEASLLGTGGNLSQLEEVFQQRGVKPFMRLAPIFQGAGGGAKGIEAVRAELAPIMGAKGSVDSMNQQYAQVMEQPAKQLERALNSLTVTAEGALAPALDKFAKSLDKPEVKENLELLVSGIGKAAEFFATNPFQVVVTAIEASITKAAIGAGIKATLEAAVSKSNVGAGIAGVIGASLAAIDIGKKIIDAYFAAQAAKENRAAAGDAQRGADAASVEGKLRRGEKVTPEDVAKIQGAAAGAEQRVKDLGANGPGLFTKVAAGEAGVLRKVGLSAPAADQAAEEAIRRHAKQVADASAEFERLKKMAAAAATALAGLKNSTPAGIPPVTSTAPTVPIGAGARAG